MCLQLIERVGLSGFLMEAGRHELGYRSEAPSVKDFAIALFKSCYHAALGLEDLDLPPTRWCSSGAGRADRNATEAFKILSAQIC